VNETKHQLDRGKPPQPQRDQYSLSIPVKEIIKNTTSTMDWNRILAIGNNDSTEKFWKLTLMLLFDEL
jgi:hypothetical protein